MSETPSPSTPANLQASSRLRPSRIGNFRFSAAEFLIALIAMFSIAPLLELFKNGEAIESGMMTLMMVLGVLAVGRRRRDLVIALALMIPALCGKWANYFQPGPVPQRIHDIAGLLFVGFIVFQFLVFILRAPRVNSEVLCAGIAGYLLLGMFWMFAYEVMALMIPGSFAATPPIPQPLHGFDALYFSIITLTTVGYGDITPISHGARTLAMTEAMAGTLYVAVLISRLVAIYSSQKPDIEEPEK